jgi:hypothetical protein
MGIGIEIHGIGIMRIEGKWKRSWWRKKKWEWEGEAQIEEK